MQAAQRCRDLHRVKNRLIIAKVDLGGLEPGSGRQFHGHEGIFDDPDDQSKQGFIKNLIGSSPMDGMGDHHPSKDIPANLHSPPRLTACTSRPGRRRAGKTQQRCSLLLGAEKAVGRDRDAHSDESHDGQSPHQRWTAASPDAAGARAACSSGDKRL